LERFDNYVVSRGGLPKPPRWNATIFINCSARFVQPCNSTRLGVAFDL